MKAPMIKFSAHSATAPVSLLLMMVLLSACGGGGDNGTPNLQPAAPQTEQPTAEEQPVVDGIEFIGAIRRSTRGSFTVRNAFDAEFVALDKPMTEAAVRKAISEDVMGCHIRRGAYTGLHPANEFPSSLGYKRVSAGEVLPVLNETGTLTELRLEPEGARSAAVGQYTHAAPFLVTASEDIDEYGLFARPITVHVPGDQFPQTNDLVLPFARPFGGGAISSNYTEKGWGFSQIFNWPTDYRIAKEVRVDWPVGSDPSTLVAITLYSFSDTDGDGVQDESSYRCIVPNTGLFFTPPELLADLDEYYEEISVAKVVSKVERRGNVLMFLSSEYFYEDRYGPLAPRFYNKYVGE